MQSGGGPTLVSPEYDGSPRSDEIGPWFAFAWVPARLETIPVYCLYADPSEAEEGVLARFRADPASIATNPPAGTRPFVLWMHQTTERAPAAYRRPLFENFPAARNPAVSEPHAESAESAESTSHAESAEGAEKGTP